MSEQKRREIKDLIEIVNQLDAQCITLLKAGADMLKAREQLIKLPENPPPDGKRAS